MIGRVTLTLKGFIRFARMDPGPEGGKTGALQMQTEHARHSMRLAGDVATGSLGGEEVDVLAHMTQVVGNKGRQK